MVTCALLARGLLPMGEFASDSELQVLAHQLETKIQQTQAAVHARATTMAEMRQLGVIVYTDADTARDMSGHELSFAALDQETIEVRQWLRDKPPLMLVRVPADAAPVSAPDKPGVYIRPARHGITITEVAEIRTHTRSDESDKLGGALLVSRDVDISGLAQQLERTRSVAWLESADEEVPLTHTPRIAGASEVRVPLGELGASNVALVVQRRPGSGRWPWLLGAALGALALALLALRRLSATQQPSPSSSLGLSPSAILSLLPGSMISTSRSTSHGSAHGSAVSQSRSSSLGSIGSVGSLVDSSLGPRRIGRYVVIKRLGSGGMADVFLARAEGPSGFEKLVALKVLKPELAEERSVVDHLITEARLSILFNHPNVVEIIDLGVDRDCYIAMEYVDGADLRRLHGLARLRRRPVPLPIVFTLVRALCDGLHSAHIAITPDGNPLELIHRDVKLANVLVGRNGVIKLSDFGIAQADPAFRGFATRNGEVKGTMAYMAPEQRLGASIDVRVDVYGVGIIAYQLISGARLNLDVIRLRTLGKEGWPHLPSLLQYRPDLPPAIDKIVQRAMAYSPGQRFATCEELDQALGELAREHDLVATRGSIATWVQELMATPLPPRRSETDPVLPLVPVETAPSKDSNA
jgi:hypothetical protein